MPTELTPMVKGEPDWDRIYNNNLNAVREALETKAGIDAAGRISPMPTAADVGATPAAHAADKSNPHGVTAAQIGAAAAGHTHTAAQIGAAAAGHTHTAAQVGAVPTARTVNGKPLSANINLAAADVGAASASHSHDGRYYTEAEIDAQMGNKANKTDLIKKINNQTFTINPDSIHCSINGKFYDDTYVIIRNTNTSIFSNVVLFSITFDGTYQSANETPDSDYVVGVNVQLNGIELIGDLHNTLIAKSNTGGFIYIDAYYSKNQNAIMLSVKFNGDVSDNTFYPNILTVPAFVV